MPNQPRKSPKQQLAELFAQADLSYFLTETDDAFVQSVATVGGWSPLGNTRPADPLNFPGFSETGDAKTGMKPWPEERNVSAEVIRWLCVNKAAAALVSGSGISIFGARIVGELNLSFAEIPFPISLRCCRVINSINLTGARIPTLILTGSWTGPIAADSADIKTDIRLDDGFRCDGGIGFWGARIGGALLCSEACFVNRDGAAILADGIKVGVTVMLRGGKRLPFRAEGRVRFRGATIAGDLDCSGGTFINPGREAISAEGVTVGGDIFLRSGSDRPGAEPPFLVEGEVRLGGAKLGGYLDCSGGTFLNKGGVAINAHEITASRIALGSEVFPGGKRVPFHAEGKILLKLARITGEIYGTGGEFINPGSFAIDASGVAIDASGVAIDASGVTVGEDVLFNGKAHANGGVWLRGAKIGGNLDCTGGRFINEHGTAIDAVNVTVGGDVFLGPFHAEGETNLAGAEIKGDLDCTGGDFVNRGGVAISADSINLTGDAIFVSAEDKRTHSLTKFRAEGDVSLTGARIGGNLICVGGEFSSHERRALDLRGAAVRGAMYLRGGRPVEGEADVPFKADGLVDLENASTSALSDDRPGWPVRGKLRLSGFVYDRIDPLSPQLPEERLDWVRRDTSRGIQPYRQLAKVLHDSGNSAGAKQVLRELEARLSEGNSRLEVLLKASIGYGYEPMRALGYLAIVSGVGALVYWRSHRMGSMVPTDKEAVDLFKTKRALPAHYPRFSPLICSLENTFPLVKLGQADKWQADPQPRALEDTTRPSLAASSSSDEPTGHSVVNALRKLHKVLLAVRAWTASPDFVRWFIWIQILLGWMLATLFLAGLTGIVQHD